jgi:hypothetical protein
MSREGVPLLVIQRQLGHRPRDYLGLPTRDRQHRGHPRRPRTTDTHDSSHGPAHARPLTREPQLPSRRRATAPIKRSHSRPARTSLRLTSSSPARSLAWRERIGQSGCPRRPSSDPRRLLRARGSDPRPATPRPGRL